MSIYVIKYQVTFKKMNKMPMYLYEMPSRYPAQ